MKWVYLFTLNLIISLIANAVVSPTIELMSSDIKGSSSTCTYLNSKYSSTTRLSEACDLRSSDLKPIKDIYIETVRSEGLRLARHVKSSLASYAQESLAEQYATTVWLSGTEFLKNDSSTQKSFDSAVAACSDVQKTSKFKTDMLNVKDRFQIQGDGVEKAKPVRDAIKKRMLIAWMELNRIERFVTDRPLSKKEKNDLRERAQKIRMTYPIIANSYDGVALRQLTKAHFGIVVNGDSTTPHPQLDDILFPNNANQFEVIAAGSQTRQGHEGLVNQILAASTLPKGFDEEINSLMSTSLKKSIDGMTALCRLNPCQTMNVSLNSTLQTLKQSPVPNDISMSAVCSCNLEETTEYVSSGKQLALVGASIGGLILCPVTFGIGCYVSAVSGAGLAASAVANTVGAIQDKKEVSPLTRAIQAFPGLLAEDRNRIVASDNNAAGRIILGVTETIVGGAPSSALVKKGTRVLKSPEAFRPIAKTKTSVEALTKSTVSQKTQLAKNGVKVEEAATPTYVESQVKYWGGVEMKAESSYFGEVLDITALPVKKNSGGTFSNAFSHPEMPEYMKSLKKMGIDLSVDTSLTQTGAGAYYGIGERIALRPDSTWQTFLHEYQHAQFDAYLRPRLDELTKAVYQEGKSVADVIPYLKQAGYTEKEVSRLEKLLKQGHTDTGIDESMATGRELDALGWKQFIPGVGLGPRSYGATHRANSLAELAASGIRLSDAQKRSLTAAKAQAILIVPIETVGVVAGGATIVMGSLKGGYEVVQAAKVIYNEKTGDVIATTPDGRVVRTKVRPK